MSKDINAVAIVHYVLHYDNETKGFMELQAPDLQVALSAAKMTLISNAIEDGVDGDSDPKDLFTITKAEFGVPSNWLGV